MPWPTALLPGPAIGGAPVATNAPLRPAPAGWTASVRSPVTSQTATPRRPRAGRAAEATPRPAVSVVGAGKTFRIPHQQATTLKERALHPLRAATYRELAALRDISVEIPQGEFFGIVGRNGSGKSTLLKCLARIYGIDRGRIAINGRLSPFIELGVGFNPELTARDNVTINAIMLGLSRREAHRRFDEIIAFAELEEFLDLRLKNYSSGMHVRLAFAVAIQVDAEILLVDEVLAVGDAAFQQKCFDQFLRLKREGRTIVFVTHDMGAVERFCDRAMLIEQGATVAIGDPADIARRYNELNFGRLAAAGDASPVQVGERAAEISRGWFEDEHGEQIVALAQGEPCRACIEVTFRTDIDEPIFSVTLRNEARHIILVLRSDNAPRKQGRVRYRAGEQAIVRLTFENWLAPSRYTSSPSVVRAGSGADVLDTREDAASLMVHGTRVTGGVIDLPHETTITRANL